MELPVKFDEVLLPKKGIDMEKWCVVACDQFTSQPAYWEKLAAFVGDEPSALNLIYPECYLSDKPQERIAKIIDNMNDYLGKDLFRSVDDGLILVERTTAHGNKRYGLMMIVDLTQYSFRPEDKALIRATEGNRTYTAQSKNQRKLSARASSYFVADRRRKTQCYRAAYRFG